MQGSYDFICFCHQVVPLKQYDTGEMKEHIRRCQIYRRSSPFFQQFQNLNLDKMLFPHLRALRIEFEIFLETIDGLLMQKNQVTNSMLAPNAVKPQQQFGSSLPHNFTTISKPNIILPSISQSSFNQPDLFSTGNLKEIFRKIEICEVCHQKVDTDIISYFEHCFKPICKPCIMKKIDKDSKTEFSFTCPVQPCRQQMSQYELKMILGDDKFEILSTQIVERQFNIVKCAVCEQKGAFEQGAPGLVKDPLTKQPLSEVHAEHYRNNRFVCVNGQCKQEQCKGCKAVPYHFGHTCEEYKVKKASKCCRYCDEPIHNVQLNLPQSLQDICNQKECQDKMQLACQKMLVCGHPCPGFKNEQQCQTCLNDKCCQGDQKGDDYCNICFVEGLKNAPIIRANCGHIFHYACILKRLEMRWHGPRIVFKFCYCPLCNAWLEFQPSQPQTLVANYKLLLQDVMKKSLDRLNYENRNKDEKVSKPGEQFYGKPQEYALAIYCYYMCFKCKQPYFGGAKDCQRALEEGDKQFKPEELICANCCEVPVGETCQQHGKDYIEFKCKFCCNIAVWFCWGTTHFCEECHKKQCNGDYVSKYPRDKLPKCPGKDKCPLKMEHKLNGEEQALGCAICRNARANQRNF